MDGLAVTKFQVPLHRNSFFIGREFELLYIHDCLMAQRLPEVKDVRILSVGGIGGAGKTQVALEYAFRYKQHYKGIFWFRAETATTLQRDFVQIYGALERGSNPNMDVDHAVQFVKDWLSRTGMYLFRDT